MLLVHAPPHPRVEYTLRLFFERLIPVSFGITDDPAAFGAHTGPKLCYGEEPVEQGSPFLRSAGLVQEGGIRPQAPAPFRWRDTLALFPVDDARSAVPFDLLSAAFYLVSRYEEYVQKERDEHGRFPPERSILVREGALLQPVVNRYAVALRQVLAAGHPGQEWPELPFEAVSTVDVDVAYAYLGRSPWRTTAAAVRDLSVGPRGALARRLAVLRGREPDPYDAYAWLDATHRRYGIALVYFLLMIQGGRRDRNIDPQGEAIEELVWRLTRHAEVGLHPSYGSSVDPAVLAREVGHLERLTGHPVRKSRQHFLKVDLPHTYRALIEAGIEEDFSMGYAGEPGFRAGIAAPFPYYDLEREESTPLLVQPLAYMDGTLKEHKAMSTDQAKAAIGSLVASVRDTGGSFISLWHNHTVNDYGPWRGWREVFLHSLSCVSDQSP